MDSVQQVQEEESPYMVALWQDPKTPSDEEASKLAMEGLGLFSNLGFGSVV